MGTIQSFNRWWLDLISPQGIYQLASLVHQVFSGIDLDPTMVIERATLSVNEFWSVRHPENANDEANTPIKEQVTWIPPPPQSQKVNSDGAFQEKTKPAANSPDKFTPNDLLKPK